MLYKVLLVAALYAMVFFCVCQNAQPIKAESSARSLSKSLPLVEFNNFDRNTGKVELCMGLSQFVRQQFVLLLLLVPGNSSPDKCACFLQMYHKLTCIWLCRYRYSVQKILWITVVHMFMFCYLIKYKTLICVCSTKLTIRGKLLYGGRIVDLPHLKKKHVQSNMVRNSVKLVLFKKWKTFLLNKNITV